MASTIRIERCPDEATATQRSVALKGTGLKVDVIKGDATVFTSDVTVTSGQVTMNDKVLWPSAPWVVIGVLP